MWLDGWLVWKVRGAADCGHAAGGGGAAAVAVVESAGGGRGTGGAADGGVCGDSDGGGGGGGVDASSEALSRPCRWLCPCASPELRAPSSSASSRPTVSCRRASLSSTPSRRVASLRRERHASNTMSPPPTAKRKASLMKLAPESMARASLSGRMKRALELLLLLELLLVLELLLLVLELLPLLPLLRELLRCWSGCLAESCAEAAAAASAALASRAACRSSSADESCSRPSLRRMSRRCRRCANATHVRRKRACSRACVLIQFCASCGRPAPASAVSEVDASREAWARARRGTHADGLGGRAHEERRELEGERHGDATRCELVGGRVELRRWRCGGRQAGLSGSVAD